MVEEEKNQIIARPTEPPHRDSITPTAVHPKAEEDSNQLKQNDRSAPPPSLPRTPIAADPTSNGNKAKSCKGCLYYSSRLKSGSRNPVCVGLTRSLPNVPPYIVGESEVEASKSGRSLSEFKYACVGYSLYTDKKGQPSDGQKTQTELPLCVGLEILVDQSGQTADSTSAPGRTPAPARTPAPGHVRNKEVGSGLPQRQSPKPSNSMGDEFFTRFTRNANLVANGVAKNVRKVGNQIKQSLDDILYPYRRRPK